MPLTLPNIWFTNYFTDKLCSKLLSTYTTDGSSVQWVMSHVKLCKPKTSKFNWVYLVKVDDALSHRVSQRVDVLLLLFRYAVYSDVGNGHDTGRSPERHRTRYDPIHLPINIPLIYKVVPKPHILRFDANVLIARIPIKWSIIMNLLRKSFIVILLFCFPNINKRTAPQKAVWLLDVLRYAIFNY